MNVFSALFLRQGRRLKGRSSVVGSIGLIIVALFGGGSSEATHAAESSVRMATDANNAAMLIIQGMRLRDAGTLDAAEAKWRKALEADPDNELARQYLKRLGRAVTNVLSHWPDGVSRKLPVQKNSKTEVENSGSGGDGANAEEVRLETRAFRISPDILTQGVSNFLARFPEEASTRTLDTSAILVSGDISASMLNQYFLLAGVRIESPKSVIYESRGRRLIVAATKREITLIDEALQALNVFQPQVMIKVEVLEMTEEAAQRLNLRGCLKIHSEESFVDALPGPSPEVSAATFSGRLNVGMFQLMLKTLRDQSDVTVLTMPNVIASNEQQAQVKIVEARQIVTGTKAANRGNNTNELDPIFEPFELGQMVDIVPLVEMDGENIQMSVMATVKEFMGYGSSPLLSVKDWIPDSAPIFRQRQVLSRVTVPHQGTMFLCGGTASAISLGSVPTGVQVHQASTQSTSGGVIHQATDAPPKTLLLFVTATLVDSTGTPLPAADHFSYR